MTKWSLENQYYVYLHVDPETDEVIYVGMGKGPRAYSVSSSGIKSYSDRHPDHSNHLYLLMNLGYLPHEWVQFTHRNLDKQNALKAERKLIKDYNPRYNRKSGITPIIPDIQKDEIIKLYINSRITYEELASKFSCSRTTIYRIIKNIKRGTN